MPTIRQQMIVLLSKGEYGVRELSQMLGIREKEVYTHLSHIARSVVPQGRELIVIAPRCLSCEYIFAGRKRFTKPSRCPSCKSERIQGLTCRVVQRTANSHG